MSSADMLADLGYAFVEAGSDEEALRLVDAEQRCDVLVIDGSLDAWHVGHRTRPRTTRAATERVHNTISRFNQVKNVSDDERDAAWKRIKTAAKKFDVEVSEKSWREIGK